MYKRILVATDGSSKSAMATKTAVDLAKAIGAEVIALNIINEVTVASAVSQLGSDRKDVEARLQAAGKKAVDEVKSLGDAAGVSVMTLVRQGAPAQMVVDVAAAEKADLIVMGSHGESGMSKLLIGSVVQKVLYWATVPVLVVR